MVDRMQRDLADRELGRALGREITRLRRHVRELEIASQGAFRSVEDGAIDVYDDDGVLRERIGKQTDGTYGRKSFTGEIPPAPTEPDVVVISDGVVAVSWDGRFEERYGGDFRNVQIHLGDAADFTPTRNTQEGAIFARRGGTVVCLTESDDDNPVWVRLVATNRAGDASPPSDAVLVDETDADSLDADQEELEWEDGDGRTLTAADITAGTVTFGLSFIPEQESLLAWWHPGGLSFAGVSQTRGTDFTVDYEAQSITWPLTDHKAGDRIRVYYAHLNGGVTRAVTIQMVANNHFDTLALTFILPDGTRYPVPGVNTPGAGPAVEFGDFVIEDMQMEFENTTMGVTVTYPDDDHIRRTAISGTDDRGPYVGYRYEFEDRGAAGDGDFNDIIMDVKGYEL